MARNHRTTIRSLALAVAGTLAFWVQIAAAKPAAKAQGLWVSSFRYTSEFQGKALERSGDPRANLAFGGSAFNGPISMTFDPHNNLWIAYDVTVGNGPPPVIEITQADVAALRSRKRVKPKVIAAQGTFLYSLAFDAAGDLWASDGGRNIMEFLPKQIKKSGGPSPSILITSEDFGPGAIRLTPQIISGSWSS